MQHKIPDSLTAPRGSSHVTSVSFSSAAGASAILAIGRGDGRITLWSPLDPDPRFDSEQPAPISYVCFRPTTQRRCSVRDSTSFVNTEELLVGDEVGNVYVYSVEWPDQDQRDLFDWHGSMTLLARISCHTQQICGIAWSPNGKLLATGGNDNNLFLFETKRILRPQLPHTHAESPAVHIDDGSTKIRLTSQSEVLAILPGRQKYTFSLNAACKAITFAPWQPSLIAAGGGSNDRCIHFFHALSGVKIATIDCYAQVTSLVFNPRKREIAATFGFAQPEHPYRVAVFAWPSCRMLVGVPWWGEERALYGIEYPGLGGSLVVATSDASIKFHEVWSGADGGKGSGSSVLGSSILDDELIMERIDTIR
jgi:meiosis-specific APC/C activator protein AMA1